MKQYIGINGVAAGGIKIGNLWVRPSGDNSYLCASTAVTGGSSPTFPSDSNEIEKSAIPTVEWVRQYVAGGNTSLDLTSYAGKTTVEFINKVLFNDNIPSSYTESGLVLRVEALENYKTTNDSAIKTLKDTVSGMGTTITSVRSEILSLDNRIAYMEESGGLAKGTILVAGGAEVDSEVS